MPEIGEVARVVHYIRKHIVGKTISKITAFNDDIVYGKVGTSAAEFEKHISGKKVLDAGQQGKYFWMIMSTPPHPVMHLGMSGWFKVKSEHTYYYRKKASEPEQEWPPRYMKFLLEVKAKDGSTDEAAFVDARRLARIRLLDCDGKEIRKHTPLKENGPDPVIDKDLVSVEWLTDMCRKKKVPIKAMLLNQAVISGIGNWVADEVMYHAKMHPEQYSNTLEDAQIKQLHESIHYVCGLSCELLADSDKFPKEWLFKHRWGKGRVKGVKRLPNGNEIQYITVGGRTSAVVPAVQKKTGPVAGDVEESTSEKSEVSEIEEAKPKSRKKASVKKRKAGDEDNEEAEILKPRAKRGKTNRVEVGNEEMEDNAEPVKRVAVRSKKSNQDEHDEHDKVTAKGTKRTIAKGVKAEASEETALKAKTTPRSQRGGEGKSIKDEVEVESAPQSDSVTSASKNKGTTKKAKTAGESVPKPQSTPKAKTGVKAKKASVGEAKEESKSEASGTRRRSTRLTK